MLQIGVQKKDIVDDNDPVTGFGIMKEVGFSCGDFSLNQYLSNTMLYEQEPNHFFDQSIQELEYYFSRYKEGTRAVGIHINQMHMPYPVYVPRGSRELNEYLQNVVARKSMEICAFFNCPHIVIHGFKLARYLGSEEAEWERTESFLNSLAPMAKEMNITMCIENLYDGVGGHLVEGPCCHAKKAAERIDRMNDRYGAQVLGFCFDTGHANLVGIDFEDFIKTLDYRLKVLHIHDNDGIGDLHQMPFTFTRSRENTASTDWEGFIRGLRAIGYQGVLSFETAPVLTAFPEEMKKDVLKLIVRVGEYFGRRIV